MGFGGLGLRVSWFEVRSFGFGVVYWAWCEGFGFRIQGLVTRFMLLGMVT